MGAEQPTASPCRAWSALGACIGRRARCCQAVVGEREGLRQQEGKPGAVTRKHSCAGANSSGCSGRHDRGSSPRPAFGGAQWRRRSEAPSGPRSLLPRATRWWCWAGTNQTETGAAGSRAAGAQRWAGACGQKLRRACSLTPCCPPRAPCPSRRSSGPCRAARQRSQRRGGCGFSPSSPLQTQ